MHQKKIKKTPISGKKLGMPCGFKWLQYVTVQHDPATNHPATHRSQQYPWAQRLQVLEFHGIGKISQASDATLWLCQNNYGKSPLK